ncbi:uncharacterized protein LOC120201987 [Hibiscus syriacus]|uniref:uncharacterized protein LOC120201987 n=1 Tax=Hibiscus syriacus TaxID=106335 RepID=UPI0019234045|nr:uncharacterized protein LOC120201987 [Hibiscus syriacus]
MFDDMVEVIGEENVLQVVTDNASNYVKAGRNTLKSAIFMNGYIYNHVAIVNMMRRFTNQRNLHRPTITRFAASFITLAQMHKQKNNLRKMITSPEWNNTTWSKDPTGKRLTSIILQERFWRNIVYVLKLT